MQAITTVGLDIAKSVFQVHGIDAGGQVVIRRQLKRSYVLTYFQKLPPCQSCLMLHRTRHLFIRQQTAVINSIRAHLAEFGIVAPVGRQGVEQLLGIADPDDKRVPEVARVCIAALGAQLRVLRAQILEFDRMIIAWHRSNETSKRLDKAPGWSKLGAWLRPGTLLSRKISIG